MFPAKKENEVKVDASRLNFMVGKINSVKMHPDADTLYVEESKFSLFIVELSSLSLCLLANYKFDHMMCLTYCTFSIPSKNHY